MHPRASRYLILASVCQVHILNIILCLGMLVILSEVSGLWPANGWLVLNQSTPVPGQYYQRGDIVQADV